MNDADCVSFLRWALPQLQMRWRGFRKVRRQVCRRVARRVAELGLADVAAYRRYLEAHRNEWPILDAMCRVTISRFFRDEAVFDAISGEVLPALAAVARARHESSLRVWCAGCASGEEVYSLALLWAFRLQERLPELEFSVVGTDIDPLLVQRARTACYSPSSVKAVPAEWLKRAFRAGAEQYCLDRTYCSKVEFRAEDIRLARPGGGYHMVLCRNTAFTYYDEALQQEVLARIRASLCPGGALVLGMHERLAAGAPGFTPWGDGKLPVYRKQEQ